MFPTQDQKSWLDFLQVLPSTKQPPLQTLEYAALLSATQGTLKVAVMHQHQQQHKQQQQQQQQFINENIDENKKQMRRTKELLEKERSKGVGSEDNSQPFSIKHNITIQYIKTEQPAYPSIQKTIKKNLTDKEYDAAVIKIFTTLKTIQNSFSGSIAYISEAAINKIIANLDYFVDGVASDNLPAGFFLTEDDKGSKVLKFDSAAASELKKTQKEPGDSYSQPPVLSDGISAYTYEEKQYTTITKKSLAALSNNLDPNLPELDDKILEKLDFSATHLKALTPVLNSQNGAIKAYALLDTLRKIQIEDPELYKSIKKCFIDTSTNLLEVANLDNLKSIREIAKFSPAQKEWWCHLTAQHTNKTSAGGANITDLYCTFKAFYTDLNSFWRTVYNSDLELPYPCPLDSIGNMQVALNRVAYIVKHAAHPKDQLQYLKGLNLQKEQNACEGKQPIRFSKDENTSTISEQIFLEYLYQDSWENTLYFPSYSVAKNLWKSLSEKIDGNLDSISPDIENYPHLDSIKNTLIQLTANMLQREAQAEEVFQCIAAISLYLKQNFHTLPISKTQTLIFVLSDYPMFVDTTTGALHPNSKYFVLALTNPTNNNTIFSAIKDLFATKQLPEQQPQKEDILSCLLSINLTEINTDKASEFINKLYELNPITIAILAKILATTDFANIKTEDIVTEKQLDKIIESCKNMESPSYITIREIVSRECPKTKFLPNLEYAKELANEAPKDLQAIIKLFTPLFAEVELSIDSNNLLDTAEKVTKKTDVAIIGNLIKPQLDNLKSGNEKKIITGLLNIVQAARDNFLAGNSIKLKLTTIKNKQTKIITELLRQLKFSEESIKVLIQPIETIDLTTGELIPKLDKLTTTTSWVKEFATHYSQLLELNKWNDASENFLKLINTNLDTTKDNINSLLNLYISQPNLNKNNFCSPDQLLKKIAPQKLETTHIEILRIIAQKQLSNDRIPATHLNLLLDVVLKFPEQKLANSLIELAFNKNKYGNFPIDAFFSFANNLSQKKHLEEITTDLTDFFAGTQPPEDKKALNSFLGILLKNSETANNNMLRYYYLKKIHQDLDSTKRKQTFRIVEQILLQENLSHPQEANSIHANIFQLITQLKYLCKADDKLFAQISALYEQKPCPSCQQLLAMLSNDKDRQAFVTKFATDPYGTRLGKNNQPNQKFITEQFSTDKVDQVVFGLSKNNPNLPDVILDELKKDFIYVNALGSTVSFPNTGTPGKPVWQMTRDNIRNHLQTCKQIINDPTKSQTEIYLAKLQSIALLRETMYRATGKMPNSTQVLSVLLQAKSQGNVCMQINTGEGKSITTPLLAAMQHLEGYAVNVFTANTLLATRDKQEAADFWNYLGITTTFIAKNSQPNVYLEEGINYTTPADFALYSAAVGNQSIGKQGMAGVYDESDLAFYETNTDFNFSDSINKENTDPYTNPYAWAYPLINDFVDTDPHYKNLINRLTQTSSEETKQKISNEIAMRLRMCLNSQANSQQAKSISEEMIDDNRLLRWLAAAQSIQQLELGKDYITKPMEREEFGKEKTYRKICLLDGEGHEIEGAILANGAHQFLSARLQTKGSATDQPPFVIDQESFCISSRNPHTELLRMKKIVGITGTIGHAELIEQFHTNHTTTDIRVPPHFTNKRKDLPPKFANGPTNHLRSIKKELEKDLGGAQLVIGADTKQCKKLFSELQEFARIKNFTLILATADGYKKYQLANGSFTEKSLSDDPEAKDEDSVFVQSSQPKTITIATPILGRGVNIKNLKKVIKTNFDPNARLESQVNGRTGRYGAEGVTIGVYDWEDICTTNHLIDSDAKTNTDNKKRNILDRIRHEAQQEEVKRLNLSSKKKEISVQYQNYFDAAIIVADTIDKKQCLSLKKQEFIEKLETLRAKIAHVETDKNIQEFEEETKVIWQEIATKNPELKTAEEAYKKNSRNTKSGYYQIQTSYTMGNDAQSLVSEYQTRNQQIYAEEIPKNLSVDEQKEIVNQFNSDLDNLYEKIKNVRRFPPGAITASNIKITIEKHIAPYLMFAAKLPEPLSQLKKNIFQELNKHIKNTTPLDSRMKQLYLHYICRAKLAAENNDILAITDNRDLNNLTANDKKNILGHFKNYIRTLAPPTQKQSILENILQNKPTGDATVDYCVTLARKKRLLGRFINDFGNTGTFQQLTEHAKQQLKELPIHQQPRQSPIPPPISTIKPQP